MLDASESDPLGVALPPGASAHIHQCLLLELGALFQADLIELLLPAVHIPLSAGQGRAILHILWIPDELQYCLCVTRTYFRSAVILRALCSP